MTNNPGPSNSSTENNYTLTTSNFTRSLALTAHSAAHAAMGISDLGLNNQLAISLPNARKAIAGIRGGTGRMKMVMIGDSTTAGAGAGSSGTTNLVGAWPYGPSRQLASQLTAAGLPAGNNGWFGDNNVNPTVAYGTYDTRFVSNTGWQYGAQPTLGGSMWRFVTGSAAADLTLDLSGAYIDTVTVWYFQGAGGSFTLKAGDNTTGTLVSTAGASQMQSATINCTRANNVTATLSAVNLTSNIYISGIYGYDSTVPAIDVLQCAFYGGKMAQFADGGASTFGPINTLKAYAPNLTTIEVTINDANNGTDLTAYIASTQQIITAAKLSGDVILFSGIPSAITYTPPNVYARYSDALKSLAATNNCLYVSVSDRWISYEVSQPLGYYSDTVGHATKSGYADKAALYASILKAIS